MFLHREKDAMENNMVQAIEDVVSPPIPLVDHRASLRVLVIVNHG